MTDRELRRRAAHRLAVIGHAGEVTGNASKTCRYDGITRQASYKWLRRYEAGGVAALRDGSSRPHTSPDATQAEDVGRIVYLRQTYHFGPLAAWPRSGRAVLVRANGCPTQQQASPCSSSSRALYATRSLRPSPARRGETLTLAKPRE